MSVPVSWCYARGDTDCEAALIKQPLDHALSRVDLTRPDNEAVFIDNSIKYAVRAVSWSSYGLVGSTTKLPQKYDWVRVKIGPIAV